MLHIVTAGNGISLIDVDFEFNAMMMGVADHFCQMFEMKYPDKIMTKMNDKAKNVLIKFNEKLLKIFHNFHYRSKYDMFLSPTYFSPCNVEFNKYCSTFPLQVFAGLSFLRFLTKLSFSLIFTLPPNFHYC